MGGVSPEVFRQLLDDAILCGRDAEARVAMAMDVEYWRGMVSADEEFPVSTTPPRDVGDALAEFAREGVYRIDGAIGADTLARLNEIVDRVLAAGWPGVFAFACDELWRCARIEPVRTFVEGALGAGAKQIPHVWAHVVRPRAQQAGWSPHIDGPGADRLTVWIALSDAGLDNGCMYAVPRSGEVEKSVAEWCASDVLDKNNVKSLLQGTRAFPAQAGDILGWAFDIVHWGGPVTPGAPGRRSLSLEFIAPHAAPGPTDEPLVPLSGPLPSHADRIRAISAALLEYRKFEPLVLRYQGIARTLLERAG